MPEQPQPRRRTVFSRQRDTPYSIDPTAFVCALVGAPLVVAFFGFWLLLIPVFALYFGAIPYLVFGTPALLWFLKRRRPNPYEVAILALLCNTVGLLILFALASLIKQIDTRDALTLYGGFGSLVAPVWGATFASLYVWFENEHYKALND